MPLLRRVSRSDLTGDLILWAFDPAMRIDGVWRGVDDPELPLPSADELKDYWTPVSPEEEPDLIEEAEAVLGPITFPGR